MTARATDVGSLPISKITAESFVAKLPGGSQAHLLADSGGARYVVKFVNNPQHRRVLINELVSTVMFQALGVPTPPIAVVELSSRFLQANPAVCISKRHESITVPVGMHFGSQYLGRLGSEVFNSVPPRAAAGCLVNRRSFAAALVVDQWLCNTDGRQILFRRLPGTIQLEAVMIDHGAALGGYDWRLSESPWWGLYHNPEVYRGLRRFSDIEPWIEAITMLPERAFLDIVAAVPSEWLADDYTEFSAVLDRLWRRKSRLPEMLTSVFRSHASFFPDWIQ